MVHQVLRELVDEFEQVAQTLSDCEDRWEEIHEELDRAQEDYKDAQSDGEDTEALAAKLDALTERKAVLREDHDRLTKECKRLEAILDQLESYTENHTRYGNWNLPIDFIEDGEFVGHIREITSEMHELPDRVVIDWEATADALKPDYYSIDIDGTEYWYR